MAIADRINEMYTHVGNVYDTLEVGGAQIYTLPNEFTQVDYIQSSGTQYIDTGVKAYGLSTNYEIEFAPTYLFDFNFLLSARENSSSRRFDLGWGSSGYGYLGYNNGSLAFSGLALTKTKITKNQDKYYVNDEYIDKVTLVDYSTPVNLTLFANNNNGTLANYAHAKLYRLKLYEYDRLIRDFIPCYRNSDNVVGLYDIVEGNFYTNKGTGVFTYGSVSREHIDKNIININAQLKNRLIDYMNNGTEKIWNNWEKVTGSGADISLSPTLEAPMKNILNGNTYQFTTTGKNLLPNNQTTQTINGLTFTVNDDKSITIRGTATTNTDYYFVGTASQYVDFGLTTGTYNLSGCSGGSEQTYMLFAVMNRNGSIYYYGSFVDTGRKMIVETGDTFRIFIRVISGQTMNTTMYPMVERGDNKTTYEPYTGGVVPRPEYPEDIHVVSGDNTIKVVEKNLLDLSSFTNYTSGGVTFTNNNGIISATGTPTSTSWNKKVNITLSPGTYTFSGVDNLNKDGLRLTLYHSDSDQYSIRKNDNTKTFTINEETNYSLTIWVQSITDFPTGNVILTPMIERNSSATEWEPYSSDSYPINLGVVNLFDNDTTTNVLIADDGTELANTNVKTSTYIKVNPNNKYTFSCDIVQEQSNAWEKISYYDENQNYLSFLYTVDKVKTITLPTNCEYVRVGYHTNFATNVQFEVGSKANSYTPYGTTPIELCDSNTYKDYFLKTSGKNLIPTSDIIRTSGTVSNGVTFTRNSDGSITANGTATSAISIYINADYTELSAGTYTFSDSVPSGESGTTYFLYADVRHVDGTSWDAYNFSTANTTTGMTQDIPGAFIFKTRIVVRNGQTLNNVVFKPMLKKGTTALPYEPYGSGEWYKYSQIGKAILNGTENGWTRSGATTEDFFVGALPLKLNGLYNKFQTSQLWKTNRFVFGGLGRDGTFLGYNGNEATGHDLIGFTIKSSIANTIEDFKNWISSNNIVFYYILLNSACTKITYEPLLEQLEAFYNAKSKNSQTNITQENNDLPFIIDSTMLKEV